MSSVPRVPRCLGSSDDLRPRNARKRGTEERQNGYSLAEIVVVTAIFGIFLYIVVMLTAEMRANEKKWPVNFMTHPEVSAVIARVRRDVEDTKSFPASIDKFTQGEKTLILYTHLQSGFAQTVVYDFSNDGEVHRYEYTGPQQQSEWVARGVPTFSADLTQDVNGEPAVHITAIDSNNRLAIDQIIVPRAHG